MRAAASSASARPPRSCASTPRTPAARCSTPSRRRRSAWPRTASPPAFGIADLPYGAPLSIEIHGAREHNLKNVDVSLGLNRFTVITGVSGSGKSTLAFDILFAEGQRRYLESLNAYARQFVQPASRPDVDAIFGIPPTVAIEQRTSRGGHKSTVATLTEIYHFLRLLYVKLGVQYCPACDARIEPQSADAIAARLLKDYRGQDITVLAPLIVARKGLYTALAKWARGKGFAQLQVDGRLLPTAKWPRLDRFIEHNIELPVATLTVSAAREPELRRALDLALEHGRGVVHVADGERPRRARRRGGGEHLFHQARLPELRHRISGTRSAAVLLQLEARLVQELLRHRFAIGAIRRRSERRGGRLAGRGRRASGETADPSSVRLRRPTPESASRCTCCSADDRSPR